jgi:hypothetical protein
VLPEPTEAAQLALEVSARAAEALEVECGPVHPMQLDQRVDELGRDPLVLVV